MNSIDKISFKANYIRTTSIKSKINQTFQDIPAYFVKLDENNLKDIDVIDELVSLWKSFNYNQNTFVSSIASDVNYCKTHKDDNRDFFLLTSQESSYENLDVSKVLGVAEFYRGESYNYLEYLQAHPEHIQRYNKDRFLKHIGTSILDCIKELSDKSIIAIVSKKARKFYECNDFVENPVIDNQYSWEKV